MANWRGTWASGTAYIADDSVTYGGVTYYCVTANTGQTPGTGADWGLMDSFTGPGAATSIEGVTVSGTPSLGKVITATSATAANWQTPVAGIALDTTPGDIKALGAQSAGTSGLAPKADHVHPVTGLMLTANNLSDVTAAAARTNLGLGTAATQATAAFDAAGAAAAETTRAEAAELANWNWRT